MPTNPGLYRSIYTVVHDSRGHSRTDVALDILSSACQNMEGRTRDDLFVIAQAIDNAIADAEAEDGE